MSTHMASSANETGEIPIQLATTSGKHGMRRVTEEIWQEKKQIIKEMYVTQNLSLPVVKQEMELSHGVKATKRMYRHQFQKWGWRKYASHKKNPNHTTHPPATKPSTQTPSALTVSRPMLHINNTTRHMTTIMTVMRHYMLSSAEHNPHWMTIAAHTNPFPAAELTHGSAMHLALLSAIQSFRYADEHARAGRFLRRAFHLLDATLATASQLSQYQTFELCGTYPHLLVSLQRTDIAVIWLRYVAARVSVASRGHPLAVMAAHMLGVIEQEQCEEWLGRLFSMGCEIATSLRGPEYRYIFLFWSRWHQGAALDLDEGMRDVSEHYGRLLCDVGREHGKAHERYVSLECALLTFASRLGGGFAERTIAGCLDLLDRLASHYEDVVDRFGRGWDHEHVKIYLDVSCVLCTLYAKSGRTGDVRRSAHELTQLTSVSEVAADLRDSVNTYLVSLELIVLDMGFARDVQRMRRERLGCAHNVRIEESFEGHDS